MRRKTVVVIFCIGLLVLVIALLIPMPVSVRFANKKAFSDPVRCAYNGIGTLYACTASGDIAPSGKNVVHYPPSEARLSGRERTVLVYTPPGYTPKRTYPLLYLLHGFAARPTFWITNLLPFLEEAIVSGNLPPVIVVMPDGTISGNGRDNPDTPVDERGGCWYIDSNLVQYREFLLTDLPDFIGSITGNSAGTEQAVIVGSSMGGFAAAHYALTESDRFPAAGLFYPALDLRYSVRGKRLTAYKEKGYLPIEKDKPLRIVNKAVGAGVLGLTESWCFYPVFNSDTFPGPVWKEDLPVWKRMEDVSPTDLLRKQPPDLSDSRFFILTGDKDDFNFDDHQTVFLPLLRETGARVDPANTLVPGGRHRWEDIEEHVPAFIRWLGYSLEQIETD